MSDGYWKPYVPVAKRRAKAQAQADKAIKSGKALEPIVITSRAIATTFWGKAWCKNLETYSDYQNRLPRARAYVRNGSVIDLKILPGQVMAEVIGSRRYHVEISISPVPQAQWHDLVKDCTGSINSLIELLQGQFSDAVMQRLCAPNKGLFPTSEHIRFVCSCPDWANMCKHVGATLYGVGARLDTDPKLLFALRQVDINDLLIISGSDITNPQKSPATSRVLSNDALSALFDIDMTGIETPPVAPKRGLGPAVKKKAKAAKRQTTAAKKVVTKKVVTKNATVNKPASKARSTATGKDKDKEKVKTTVRSTRSKSNA